MRARFRQYNLLLISIDTLRADYVGAYGNKKLTPAIDALAGKSFLFESMFTTSSTTLPAHLSLMTSQYPRDCRNGYAAQDSVTPWPKCWAGMATPAWPCQRVAARYPLQYPAGIFIL